MLKSEYDFHAGIARAEVYALNHVVMIVSVAGH